MTHLGHGPTQSAALVGRGLLADELSTDWLLGGGRDLTPLRLTPTAPADDAWIVRGDGGKMLFVAATLAICVGAVVSGKRSLQGLAIVLALGVMAASRYGTIVV